MSRPKPIITSLILALTAISATNSALATRIQAQPLPTERELKDFRGSQGLTPEVTRFQRRMDFREEEKARQEEAEAQRKRSTENAARAQAMQMESVQQRKKHALEQNNKGVTAGKVGRWHEAIAAHEEAVKYDPQHKQYRINLSAARCAFGQERLSSRDLDAAMGLFRKALAAAPDNALAQKLLVETMKKKGLDPSSADERMIIGDQLMTIGDFEGAMVEYQTAIQLEPSARTYTKMGDVAVRFNQPATAVNWYRQAITKDARHGPAHRQLGMLQMNQKDFQGASTSLRKAVILDSKDAIAGQNLVELWRRQVAANPLLAENHLGLAGALQLTGDFIGAEAEYNKLEALDANHPSLAPGRASLNRARQHAMADKHMLAAETLFNQGLRREALAEISQAVMMEPKNAKYQFLLGECLEANGDLRGAHQAYLTAVLIDPENNKEAAYRMKEMQRGNTLNNQPIGQPQPAAMPQQPQSLQSPAQIPAQAPMQMPAQITAQMPAQVALQNPTVLQPQAVPQTQSPPSYSFPASQAVQPVAAQPEQAIQQSPVFRKNVFEGGAGVQNASAGMPMSFATHDEPARSSSPPAQHQPAPTTSTSPVTATALQPAQPQAVQSGAVNHASPLSPAQTAAMQTGGMGDLFARATDLEVQKDYGGAVKLLRGALPGNLQNAELHHRLAVDLLANGEIADAIAEFRIASALRPTDKNYAGDLARAMAIHKRSLDPGIAPEGAPGSGKEVAVK